MKKPTPWARDMKKAEVEMARISGLNDELVKGIKQSFLMISKVYCGAEPSNLEYTILMDTLDGILIKATGMDMLQHEAAAGGK